LSLKDKGGFVRNITTEKEKFFKIAVEFATGVETESQNELNKPKDIGSRLEKFTVKLYKQLATGSVKEFLEKFIGSVDMYVYVIGDYGIKELDDPNYDAQKEFRVLSRLKRERMTENEKERLLKIKEQYRKTIKLISGAKFSVVLMKKYKIDQAVCTIIWDFERSSSNLAGEVNLWPIKLER